MRFQQTILTEIERILRITCGMVCMKSERIEIVPLVLDIRTLDHMEAHVAEDPEHLIECLGEQVQFPGSGRSSRKSVVEVADVLTEKLLQLIDPIVNSLDGSTFENIDSFARVSTGIFIEVFQTFHQPRESSLLRKKVLSDNLDSSSVLSVRDAVDLFCQLGEFITEFFQSFIGTHDCALRIYSIGIRSDCITLIKIVPDGTG